jgi:hypothetical protein
VELQGCDLLAAGIVRPKTSDVEFIELFESVGATETAVRLGISEKNIYRRRRHLELKLQRKINARNPTGLYKQMEDHPARINLTLKDGIVIVGSDSHYYPGIISTAHKAFVRFCKELKPQIVVKNGDEIDGAAISRHPPIGWEHRPTVQQEIEACQDRLHEIFQATKNARHVWPLGNHDARFSTRLATVAPEYAKVRGVQLKEHFVGWQPCWSVWVNDVVIKHRFKNGIHATHNNTMWSGRSIVTGHLHSLKVTPLSDYDGTRWGVDCGTLADPYGPQFINYLEDGPTNWRSGFVVLTFRDGRLMWPEVVHVVKEGVVEFRGEYVHV